MPGLISQRAFTFRCTGCGNCCRDTFITCTDADVHRLVSGTGMAVRDVVRFASRDEVVFDQRHPYWIRFGDKKRVMVLRRRGRSCGFLDAEDRCTVYEHRPLVCREHPFETSLSTTGGLWGFRLARVPNCDHAWDGEVSKQDVLTIARAHDGESDAYAQRVRAWNRERPGAGRPADFLRYIGFDT